MEEAKTVDTSSIHIEASWKEVLKDEFSKDYFLQIKNFLKQEKQKGTIIYPPGKFIFNAYDLTPFEKVKVIILGQDPYHGAGQAHGLSFSVPHGVAPPPSLMNIYKELKTDIAGFDIPGHGNLEGWAKQGVFLLNVMLTVEKDKPASHQHIGWQNFTDATIRHLNDQRKNLVFLLWGKFAQEKVWMIDADKHLILRAPHPSPFSADRGFFGCGHFSKTNVYLNAHYKEIINWKN
ncbi:MAG: uracil-DNA glycosylase [Chitinophagales bacterium]|nr:uracil-DNA glycosylase [Chitinophagales bacterium]